MTKRCLAIDIGASSGRHILGWREDGALLTEEVYRFPNGVAEQDGHLVWDIDALLKHVKAGIEKAREKHEITSLSIDTWGVDYVLLRGEETVYPSAPTGMIARRQPSNRSMSAWLLMSSTAARGYSSSPSTRFISCTPTSWPGGWRVSRTSL